METSLPCMAIIMETFEFLTLLGGIMIGAGVSLLLLAAAAAYFLGEFDES